MRWTGWPTSSTACMTTAFPPFWPPPVRRAPHGWRTSTPRCAVSGQTVSGSCTTAARTTAIPLRFIVKKSASSTRSWHSGSAATRLSCSGISPTKWAATATASCVRPRSAAGSRRGMARWKRSTRHGTPGSGATITPTGRRSKALPRREKTRCRGLHWTGSASSATGTLTS